MSRRILVLGGTGFVGGAVARALARRGDEVVVLSRHGGAGVRRADRSSDAELARALAGESFDATIDCAAYDGAGVEALARTPGFSPGRYITISTGQVCLVTTAPSMPYREEDAGHPVRPEPPADTYEHRSWSYGVRKRAMEAAALRLADRAGWDITILRLPVVLGAGDTSLRTWAWLERFLDGGPVLLPDGGDRPIRFIWVEDAARAMERLIELRPPSRVYHLAQPDIVTLRVLLERIARLAGVEPHLVPVDHELLETAGIGPEILPYTSRWVSVLDPARAEREWGFRGTALDDYLPSVVAAHLAHRPDTHDMGYHARPREIELARRLESAAR